MTEFSNKKSIITITNTSFSSITVTAAHEFLIQLYDASLHLEGPVIFTQITTEHTFFTFVAIIFVHGRDGIISYHNYIEFSKNEMTAMAFQDHAKYIVVKENTLINMTDNPLATPDYTIDSQLAEPCSYQYNSQGKILMDIIISKLNCSIMLHNDRLIHALVITHCRWLPGSAFNSTKPIDVNKQIIKVNFPFDEQKHICDRVWENRPCTRKN